MDDHDGAVGAMSSPLLHDEDQGKRLYFYKFTLDIWTFRTVETLMPKVPT